MERVDQLEALIRGKGARKLQRLLEVLAVFHQFDPLGQHGAILLFAVAVGNDNDRLQTQKPRSHAHTLAMISARGRHHASQASLCLLEPVKIHERSPQFERSHRRMILMLDPGLGSQPVVDERPTVLGRRRHGAIDHGLGVVNLG